MGFSAITSEDFWGEPLGLLIDQFKVKSMVIMADAKYLFSVASTEWGYKMAARKGVKVLHDKGRMDVESGWTDFTPQVAEIRRLAPDLVAALLFPPDMGHLAIALKRGGIDPKVKPVFGFGAVMPDFIAAAGEAGEGWYGTGDFDAGNPDPLQQIWAQKLGAFGKSISSDPAIHTVHNNTSGGYIAATFICEAIKRTKITPDTPLEEARIKIRDELPKIKMQVYNSEVLRLGEGGQYEKNRVVAPMYLFQVKGGKMIRVGEL